MAHRASWYERNRVGYIIGITGNKLLLSKVAELPWEIAIRRATGTERSTARPGTGQVSLRIVRAVFGHRLDFAGIEAVDVIDQIIGDQIARWYLLRHNRSRDQEVDVAIQILDFALAPAPHTRGAEKSTNSQAFLQTVCKRLRHRLPRLQPARSKRAPRSNTFNRRGNHT